MALMSILINFGFLVFGVTDYVGHKFSAHYGAVVARQPREESEQEACRRVGRRLAEWCVCLLDNKPDAHPLKQTYDRFPDKGT